MSINKLILGDNLEILKGMEADSVDLVYVRLLSNPLFLLIIVYYGREKNHYANGFAPKRRQKGGLRVKFDSRRLKFCCSIVVSAASGMESAGLIL
jgi:hypothetical protein